MLKMNLRNQTCVAEVSSICNGNLKQIIINCKFTFSDLREFPKCLCVFHTLHPEDKISLTRSQDKNSLKIKIWVLPLQKEISVRGDGRGKC